MASDQIRQMVNFILQEAHEKANEIRVKVSPSINQSAINNTTCRCACSSTVERPCSCTCGLTWWLLLCIGGTLDTQHVASI